MSNLGRTEEAEASFKQAEALKPNDQLSCPIGFAIVYKWFWIWVTG
ncbi:hypothetical protein [Aerosakkonema funiforme]